MYQSLCDFRGWFLLKGKSHISVWISSFFFNFNFVGGDCLQLGSPPLFGKKLRIIVGKWHMKEQWVDISYRGTQFNSEYFVWIHVLFCHYCSWNWHVFAFTAWLKQWTEKNFHGVWFKVTLELADLVPVLAKVGSLFPFSFLMIKWMKTNRSIKQYVWTYPYLNHMI